jgi:hypothetical protein
MALDAKQRERVLRGIAAEEIFKSILPDVGCTLVRQYRGGESHESAGGKLLRPDFDVICSGQDMTIEVKEAGLLERDTKTRGIQTYRMGRFQLSPDGKTKEVHPKDCYALMVDDPLSSNITIDFVKSDKVDAEFKRLIKDGQYPKFPLYRILELRLNDRCMLDVGTILVDRAELTMYLDKSFNKMLQRENIRRSKHEDDGP